MSQFPFLLNHGLYIATSFTALLQFSFYHSPAQKFDDGVLAHRGGLKRAPHKRDLEMEKNSMLQRSLGRTELAVMFQVHKSILASLRFWNSSHYEPKLSNVTFDCSGLKKRNLTEQTEIRALLVFQSGDFD